MAKINEFVMIIESMNTERNNDFFSLSEAKNLFAPIPKDIKSLVKELSLEE